MKELLIRVVLYGLLLGFGMPAVNYYAQRNNPTEAGPYDFWEGVVFWILISIPMSILIWWVEKYIARNYQKAPTE